jgi:hypothetical protein
VLFYTRGEDQKPDQVIRDPGSYNFSLVLNIAESNAKPVVSFDRALVNYDARAFTDGTLPLYSENWNSASNTKHD